MTTKQSLGGIARAAKLSPERRAEIAKNAASKRWALDTQASIDKVEGKGAFVDDSAPCPPAKEAGQYD